MTTHLCSLLDASVKLCPSHLGRIDDFPNLDSLPIPSSEGIGAPMREGRVIEEVLQGSLGEGGLALRAG